MFSSKVNNSSTKSMRIMKFNIKKKIIKHIEVDYWSTKQGIYNLNSQRTLPNNTSQRLLCNVLLLASSLFRGFPFNVSNMDACVV